MELIHRISIILLLVTYISIQALLFDDSSSSCFTEDDSVAHVNSILVAELNLKELELFYAAVIDAGSTGTRLHLFEFTQKNPSYFEVQKEIFKEVKPGLSSFSTSPEEAARSVQELLDTARAKVPETHLNRTPIVLKATAGLRLLPNDQSDAILKKVKDRVSASGFLVEDNAVAVLSGTDEGVFSWFTLNVLLDRMKNLLEESTECDILERPKVATQSRTAAAALDLGGGSTQVTFLPKNPKSAFEGLDEAQYSHSVNVFGRKLRVFTHSYLGNGLIAARLGITQSFVKSRAGAYLSECFPDSYVLQSWNYAGQQWSIKGKRGSFTGCLRSAEDYVRKMEIKKVPELNEHEIYAFSYYYDRGVQAGLVSQTADNRGGFVSIVDFKKAARRACAMNKDEIGHEHWQPWQCLDLTYIYALLYSGYGLEKTKKIYLAKRFRNMEMSWALGASYDLIHSYHGKLASSRNFMNDSLNVDAQGTPYMPIAEILNFLTEKAVSVFSFFSMLS